MSVNPKERLSSLLEQHGMKTVKELLTSTSGVILPQMVADAVLLNLATWRDYRELATVKTVPPGRGKVVNFQLVTSVAYDNWTEGSALAAADPTVATRTATLAPFGKVTLVSDLLANTEVFDFIQTVARAHAGSVRMGIVDKIVDEMESAAAANEVPIGTKGDTTEADYTMANMASAIQENMNDGFISDFIATSPEKFWKAMTTSYAVTQFTGAMADFLLTGKAPVVMGLECYMDPYYETAVGAFAGTDGEEYAVIGTKGLSACWGQLQENPVVDIERLVAALSNYVVTHIDGGAVEGFDASICVIQHAA